MLCKHMVKHYCSKSFSRSISISKLEKPILKDINLNEVKPSVFNVELNRAKQMNTFTPEFWFELKSVITYLSQYSGCRSIVLSGAGKSFTSGIDLKEALSQVTDLLNDSTLDIARKGRILMNIIGEIQDCYSILERCPKPIISSIHSHCIGAGVNMICGTDIRYASKDAIFNIKEVDVGMTADIGVLNRIQKIVGNDSLTRELSYTARDFNADEALKLGLISKIFDNKQDCFEGAIETAKLIAEKSPVGVQGTKIALNHARNHSIEDSLEFIKIWNASQLLTEDLEVAAKGFLTKKKVSFNNV
ncbi:Delta(3,5)-Delta(2,4)-dienoyl-CoA isomerase, mitochondrial [Strongyloides ratti]|uniref:Delta(3,5)-Delta(2,4)-dienoyl-CoA isomerase, mitochondrial n=1 Tax=Strongyloides ratti TaxID=34506 RepID=A0A090KYY9_STRRB|nr:Delta(3,5)-Delta(2,4)-dienoyl-CoA isomerase, mitochondrial [Strongyloides ratti]CEF62700.1 Delta(3,5)-Delta(2,4)-dienoyl-CoA isomerase, mitochondrial [Strongyloides ratti]